MILNKVMYIFRDCFVCFFIIFTAALEPGRKLFNGWRLEKETPLQGCEKRKNKKNNNN